MSFDPSLKRRNLDLAMSVKDNTYLVFHQSTGQELQCGVMYGAVFYVNEKSGSWEQMSDDMLGMGTLEKDEEPAVEKFVTHGGAVYLTSKVPDESGKELRYFYNEDTSQWEVFPHDWLSQGVFLPLNEDGSDEVRYYRFTVTDNPGETYITCIGEEEVRSRLYLDTEPCSWVPFHDSWESQGSYSEVFRCSGSDYETFQLGEGSFISAVDPEGQRHVLDISDGAWFPFPSKWEEDAVFSTVPHDSHPRVVYGVFDFDTGSRVVTMDLYEKREQVFYLSDDHLTWLPFPADKLEAGEFTDYDPNESMEARGSSSLLLPELPRSGPSLDAHRLSPESSMSSLRSRTPESMNRNHSVILSAGGDSSSKLGASGRRKRRVMKKSPSATSALADNQGNSARSKPAAVRRVSSFQVGDQPTVDDELDEVLGLSSNHLGHNITSGLSNADSDTALSGGMRLTESELRANDVNGKGLQTAPGLPNGKRVLGTPQRFTPRQPSILRQSSGVSPRSPAGVPRIPPLLSRHTTGRRSPSLPSEPSILDPSIEDAVIEREVSAELDALSSSMARTGIRRPTRRSTNRQEESPSA